jgi:hypothetical protein
MKENARKIAGIAAVVLAVGGGTYLAGSNGLGACDAKAKATALTNAGATTCEKVHASAMAKADGAVTAKNAAVTDDCCADEAKATNAAMVSKDGDCGAKATNAVLTSKSGDCGAKVKNTVLTGAEACPYMKSHTAKTTVVSAQEGDCSEGACPTEKDAKGASKKAEPQKATPKRTMASVVPAESATK